MSAAPIALFVYNRPWHTRQTIEALKKNNLAGSSDLFIFSDGPQTADAEKDVQAVREYVGTVRGFRSIEVFERERNFGLAESIVDGVSRLCNEFGKAIVLEDDIVTSPYFLEFMNQALKRYEAEKTVWHISGWNYPVDENGLPEAFFLRVMNCWGWATWADRWAFYRKEPERLVKTWSKRDIRRFNLDGAHDFWWQVTSNYTGALNTWAIFWYATIFENSGFCLNPAKTFVRNIGHDGSGMHSQITDIHASPMATRNIRNYPQTVVENERAVDLIKRFYRSTQPNLLVRARRNISRGLKLIIRLIIGRKTA